MPKNTFLNLPKEKQQRILNAAAEEFIYYKNQYEKSSVNRIAEKANISVGSIYKYFYDKDDLFFCVFNDKKAKAESLPESDTLYHYSKNEIDINGNGDPMSSDMVDIIVNNSKLFQDLVFKDTLTQDYLRELKDHLEKDQERGYLREDIDLDIAAYLYSTMEFNAYQYGLAYGKNFSKDERKNIFHKMTEIFFFGLYNGNVEGKIP